LFLACGCREYPTPSKYRRIEEQKIRSVVAVLNDSCNHSGDAPRAGGIAGGIMGMTGGF
jgi:hypothetical protein